MPQFSLYYCVKLQQAISRLFSGVKQGGAFLTTSKLWYLATVSCTLGLLSQLPDLLSQRGGGGVEIRCDEEDDVTLFVADLRDLGTDNLR